jgi:hypothetical protein
MKSGQVFVKTPGAEYSLNAKSVLPDVKVGDELTIWVSDNNVAVDHHAVGTSWQSEFVFTVRWMNIKAGTQQRPVSNRTFPLHLNSPS